MEHLHPLISDLAWILVLASITSIIFKRLKQPVVLGYIVAGVLVGGNFSIIPHITDINNIKVWAEIGIIFLLFTLGLEFSFKKLTKVGSPALITASVIIAGMISVGFTVGKVLGWSTTDCVFLGGMLSMSSTTIIFKAFSDLKLRSQKFASMVFGVLIVEDLFAVILMVMLSSIYLHDTFSGSIVVGSVTKLLFFLVLWFIIGIYLIPTVLKKLKRFLNQETLLIVSLGLCLGMVVITNYAGFSSALGAFIMGSILGETVEAKSIEKVMSPVRNLFGAIFFVSVGMLVDPALILENWFAVILIIFVVIVGQVFFASLGMLLSGQNLKLAIQSGFSLTQIGEFAFIIASLGVALKVTSDSLYPIAVAVSVITTFLTPFMIKMSEPAYNYLNTNLPSKTKIAIERYNLALGSINLKREWTIHLKFLIINCIIFSTLCWAVLLLSLNYITPYVEAGIGSFWGKIFSFIITISLMFPFLWGLAFRKINKKALPKLWVNKQNNRAILVLMTTIRLSLTIVFIVGVIINIFSYRIGTAIILSVLIIALVLLSRRFHNGFGKFERQFKNNLNGKRTELMTRENRHIHLIKVDVSQNSEFIGKTLSGINFRRNYGVTVVAIARGCTKINMPTSKDIIMPMDTLSILGTDNMLSKITPLIEREEECLRERKYKCEDIEIKDIKIDVHSSLRGKTISETNIQSKYNVRVVGITRHHGKYLQATGSTKIFNGDTLWIASEPSKLKIMKLSENI